MIMVFQPGAVLNTQGFGPRPEGVEVPHLDTRAPATSDFRFPVGKVWVDTSAGSVYALTSLDVADGVTTANWGFLGSSSGDLNSLTTDDLTVVTPTSGTIIMAGTANEITTSGANSPGTVTLALDSTLIAPGTLEVTGLLTADASATIITGTTALNLGADNSTGQINIGTGTSARTIHIGTGAAANVIGIGSSSAGAITIDTAAGISLDAATASNFTVTGASADLTLSSVGGSVGIAASEAASDAIVINASDAAGGVQVQAGTGGVLIGNQADCTTIDVGNAAPGASRTITIGGGTVVVASVTDTIDIGVDGATTNADSVKVVNIGTGNVTTGENNVNINTGTCGSGTQATNIATGTGGGTKTVNIGNADGLTTVTLDADLHFGTAGNKIISDNVATTTTAGDNSFGTVTLVNGTATISTTSVTANSIIMLSRQGIGSTGAAALGVLTIGTIVAGTSFVITAVQPADATAAQTTDVSVIGWMIIN